MVDFTITSTLETLVHQDPNEVLSTSNSFPFPTTLEGAQKVSQANASLQTGQLGHWSALVARQAMKLLFLKWLVVEELS